MNNLTKYSGWREVKSDGQCKELECQDLYYLVTEVDPIFEQLEKAAKDSDRRADKFYEEAVNAQTKLEELLKSMDKKGQSVPLTILKEGNLVNLYYGKWCIMVCDNETAAYRIAKELLIEDMKRIHVADGDSERGGV